MPVIAQCCCVYATFDADDAPVSFGGSHPNADAAAAAFLAAAGSTSLIDFESAPLGNVTSLVIATGVTMTTSNLHATLSGISNDNTNPSNGFDTTPTGTQYFRFVNAAFSGPTGTGSVTFSFTTPIKSFGMFLTGFESIQGANPVITYNDGTPHSITLTRAATAGVKFWGFACNAGSVSSITITQDLSAGSPTRDLFGIDDIYYA